MVSVEAADYFFASDDGLQLHCVIYVAQWPGGVPVLCLPGLTRNSRDFAELGQHLQLRHEVLAPDLRGRGRSAWDPDPSHYRLTTYVQDAWTLLDSRGVSRAAIIGTSLGALVGMVMAAAQPSRIRGLVLNDIGPEFNPIGLQRIAAYAGKLPPVSTWQQAAAQTKSVYGSSLIGLSEQEWLAYARCGYREDSSGAPVADVDPRIAEMFNQPRTAAPADLWQLYAQVRVPMLVIRGELSDLLSAATVERMARESPDLRHITVPNRGHAPLLNEPECVTAIDAFLARYGNTT